MLGESISNGLSCPSEEAENVDAAIADALQSVKNRSTGSKAIELSLGSRAAVLHTHLAIYD